MSPFATLLMESVLGILRDQSSLSDDTPLPQFQSNLQQFSLLALFRIVRTHPSCSIRSHRCYSPPSLPPVASPRVNKTLLTHDHQQNTPEILSRGRLLGEYAGGGSGEGSGQLPWTTHSNSVE